MTRSGVSDVIVGAVVVLILGSLPTLISAHECTSIDVRNNIASLYQLEGCSVIRGYLMIVLLNRNVSVSDYSNITFPELREITDFFILYDVKGLTSFKKLLPNLTVIRGRRLFLNYALAVSNMPDLAAFEFKSLVAIQRGNVFIGSCPKLCFLRKVNWDRLTLSPGENHIIPETEATCAPSDCTGCESEYCWSNMVCQKFENDNVVNLALGSLHCHPECLGGCFNTTNAGCVVCKGISDHGVCVKECPSDLYYSEHHQRCYTKPECHAIRGYVLGNECNRECPSGYLRSRKVTACIKCAAECIKACVPEEGNNAFYVYHLHDVENIKGCYRLNSSLYISIQNKIDEKDLVAAFDSVHEVSGHVKIIGSTYLKSLDFLRNLEKIEGLENQTYALIIYKNDNLQELWSPPAGKMIEFNNGGIYSYSNYKLCNHVLREFSQQIIHDKDKDLMQINDLEVICDPARLYSEVKQVTQNNATIYWPKNQTAEEVEVLYREAKYSKGEQSELDDHVCTRVNWKRELLFQKEISHNISFFAYKITDLKPYTLYEVFVKTFQEKDFYSARSQVQLFVTAPDYPTAPKLDTLEKTTDSITLTWKPRNETMEKVNYYLLETFEQAVDIEALDTRNFCDRPAMIFGYSPLEDYDDCCARTQQDEQDDQFGRDMENMFPCTVRSKENCHNMVTYGLRANTTKINARLQNYTVKALKPFTLYSFYMYACNEVGCGTYYMYSDKTNLSEAADEVGKVEACRMPETNEYHLNFKEPTTPNGAIVAYVIHFQKQIQNSSDEYQTQLTCVTRKQHELSGFQYVTTLNFTFDQVAVRSTSLAGSVLSKWYNIEICEESEPKRGMGAMGMFMVSFAICAFGALIYVAYRNGWWRIRRSNAQREETDSIAGAVPLEDRQVLVATFDTVPFRNPADEE